MTLAPSMLPAYQCHGRWDAEGVTYVVASPTSRPSGAPRRVCFAYSALGVGGEGMEKGVRTPPSVTLTARHDTCSPQTVNAHLTLNATLTGESTLNATLTGESTLNATLTGESTLNATLTGESTLNATLTGESTLTATLTV